MSASNMYDTLSEGKHNNTILAVGLAIFTEKAIFRTPLKQQQKKVHIRKTIREIEFSFYSGLHWKKNRTFLGIFPGVKIPRDSTGYGIIP